MCCKKNPYLDRLLFVGSKSRFVRAHTVEKANSNAIHACLVQIVDTLHFIVFDTALRTLTQPLPSSLLLPLQLLPLALLPPYPFFLHREVTFKNISASFCPNSSHLVPPVPPARCQALCSLCGARLGAAEARGRTRAAGKRHKKIKDSIEEQSQRFPPGLVRGASPRAVSEAGVWAL